ncbi:hypothetical protein, partial [Aestuariivirga sp.]|uniref:hypothetical protein n=1 Tax=Aestuariivirga sp. TaxID=2650926 RepID=UPI00301928F1
MRHEERPGSEAEEHYRNHNALLPAHAQATFLLGMAQTSTGVMRPMIVAMVSGSTATPQITIQHHRHRGYNLYSAWCAKIPTMRIKTHNQ